MAAPGQAIRLGGAEPQGPATRAVTAVHHNPAMLGAMRGTALQLTGSVGVDQVRVRRYLPDPSTGTPTTELGDPVSVANPKLGYFMGASFYFDPIAFGVALYDLDSQMRTASADPLRFHLAPDPDPNCFNPGQNQCPPNGGAVRQRQDLTLALALNRSNMQFGAAVHFPRLRSRFAFDNDTELTPAPQTVTTARCEDKEDPLCAERVGFKGAARWIPRNDGPAGFDAAITVGYAVEFKNDRITLGARYRTFPLRRGGRVVLDGEALVCRPDVDIEESEGRDVVPPCGAAEPVRASLTERLPQEVALGGSFVLGRSRLWRLDTNLYWTDNCPGGAFAGRCGGRDAQTLRLVGLGTDSFVRPEFSRYRGAQDIYGAEAHVSYRIRSGIGVLFSGTAASPSVGRSAQTAALGDGWRVSLGAGARFRVGESSAFLTPGYALDLMLPRDVSPAEASFDPGAATRFDDSGGDLNATGAGAVLAGRARSTNAGRYFGSVNVLTLTLTWGEVAWGS